ncbi:DUF397 domain-containing protein [Streptomyces scopuliridis]|uniref:DUF397 domain-containing protein n=1 Tax=Streptomyces scopuliridis TaxID=452529 RepID=UPI0036B7D63B
MSDKFEFRKSSYSNLTGECVEVALNLPGTVAVRDSKRQTGPVVRVTPAAWDAFRAGLRKP